MGRISWLISAKLSQGSLPLRSFAYLTASRGGWRYTPANSTVDRRGAPPENNSIIGRLEPPKSSTSVSRAGAHRWARGENTALGDLAEALLMASLRHRATWSMSR